MDICPRGFISENEFLDNFDLENDTCQECRFVKNHNGMIYCSIATKNINILMED